MSLRPDQSQSDYELLSAYIDNMLADDERMLLEDRLDREPLLRHELTALQETVTLIGQLPPLKAPKDFVLSPTVVKNSQLTIVSQRVSRRPRSLPLTIVPVMSAAASMILVVAGMILLFSGDAGGDSELSRAVNAPEVEVGMLTNVSPGEAQSTAALSAVSSPVPTLSLGLGGPDGATESLDYRDDSGIDQDLSNDTQLPGTQEALAFSVEPQPLNDNEETGVVEGGTDNGRNVDSEVGEIAEMAQVPVPMATGQQEAPGAAQAESDDYTNEFVMQPTPTTPNGESGGVPPPAPMTTGQTSSDEESRVVEDREWSTDEGYQVLPSPALEEEPTLAMEQPAVAGTAVAVTGAEDENMVDGMGDVDDRAMPDLSVESVPQPVSSNDTDGTNRLLGGFLVAAGTAMFIFLVVVVRIQKRHA